MIDDKEYQKLKENVERLIGQKITQKRITALGVNPPYHGQPKRLIEVGKACADLEPGAPAEEVIAIFESRAYCVCTPSRGGGQGLPYFFTRDAVYLVKESG